MMQHLGAPEKFVITGYEYGVRLYIRGPVRADLDGDLNRFASFLAITIQNLGLTNSTKDKVFQIYPRFGTFIWRCS